MTKQVVLGPIVLAGLMATMLPAAATVPGGTVTITSRSHEALQLFELGRYYVMNQRLFEGARQLERAVGLDPDFALAHAYLAILPPSDAAAASAERALALGRRLPDPERWLVEALIASHRGESGKSLGLLRAAGEQAPGDWHTRYWHGSVLLGIGRYDLAEQVLRQSIALDPTQVATYNQLGYAVLLQGRVDEALVIFRQYQELAPAESNPHDSLAEGLLAAGRFEEAEQSFVKAQDGFRFPAACTGSAQARYLGGDRAGARQLLAQGRASLCPHEQLQLDGTLAWFQFADGETDAASAALDLLERRGLELGVDGVPTIALLDQALMRIMLGQEHMALRWLDRAAARMADAELSGDLRLRLDLWRLSLAAQAFARSGFVAEAEEAGACAARMAPEGDVRAQSAVHFARAQVALGRGDLAAAERELSHCHRQDDYYLLEQSRVLRLMGKDAAANAVRAAIVGTSGRNPRYLAIRNLAMRPDVSVAVRPAVAASSSPAASPRPLLTPEPGQAEPLVQGIGQWPAVSHEQWEHVLCCLYGRPRHGLRRTTHPACTLSTRH